MGHKCFISFKKEDEAYKKTIQSWADRNKVDMIDKSLNTPINSDDEDYIMRKIREDYLSDSTVTIFLIGSHSSENLGLEEQKYIKRELQASLYNGEGNTRSGILGVVLPQMYDDIFRGAFTCMSCGYTHNWVAIDDNTVIKEFHGRRRHGVLRHAGQHAEIDGQRFLRRYARGRQDRGGRMGQGPRA